MHRNSWIKLLNRGQLRYIYSVMFTLAFNTELINLFSVPNRAERRRFRLYNCADAICTPFWINWKVSCVTSDERRFILMWFWANACIGEGHSTSPVSEAGRVRHVVAWYIECIGLNPYVVSCPSFPSNHHPKNCQLRIGVTKSSRLILWFHPSCSCVAYSGVTATRSTRSTSRRSVVWLSFVPPRHSQRYFERIIDWYQVLVRDGHALHFL